ncbi:MULTISPECIES: DUF6387 family protein [Rahnella]|uniref:DUF2971 domain-containing protein n=1 Tax=Rahnella laticis TaxID=2787622 RepID=A0ABS0E291_9GAMM|nr:MULTISPECIES: DUF6387 family protein [Rahnella]MBF7979213.1 hypothetical protein [Rahnella laticis]MBF7999522.1 hypothetical protein [Rahnella sp. LAC-M12]
MKDEIKDTNVARDTEEKSYYHQVLSRAKCEKYNASQEDVDWFDIKNYQFTNRIPFKELICELIARVDSANVAYTEGSYGIVSASIFDKIYSDIITGHPTINNYFVYDHDDPRIISLANKMEEEVEISDSGELKFITLDQVRSNIPVRELNISDIHDCYHATSSTEIITVPIYANTSHPCYTGFLKKEDITNETTLTTIQSKNHGIEQLYLSVDLSFSEAQLITAFEKILAELRPHKKLTRRKILDIKLHKILPLMDLIIWQVKEKKRLPLRQIFNLLEGLPVECSDSITGFDWSKFNKGVLRTLEKVLGQGTLLPLLDALDDKTGHYDISLDELQDKAP